MLTNEWAEKEPYDRETLAAREDASDERRLAAGWLQYITINKSCFDPLNLPKGWERAPGPAGKVRIHHSGICFCWVRPVKP